MAGAKDNTIEFAERIGRRLLERVGDLIDRRLPDTHSGSLSAHELSSIVTLIEDSIDSNLREDQQGIKQLAPNSLSLMLTYEKDSQLSREYIKALRDELQVLVLEHIENHRYKITGRVQLQISSDIFAKTISVKTEFSEQSTESGTSEAAVNDSDHQAVLIKLVSSQGNCYSIRVKPGDPPAYIGRAAGAAIRLDDNSVSRLHASISMSGNLEVVLSDLGSSNGTFFNDRIVENGELPVLKSGDVVRIGDVTFSVTIDG